MRGLEADSLSVRPSALCLLSAADIPHLIIIASVSSTLLFVCCLLLLVHWYRRRRAVPYALLSSAAGGGRGGHAFPEPAFCVDEQGGAFDDGMQLREEDVEAYLGSMREFKEKGQHQRWGGVGR